MCMWAPEYYRGYACHSILFVVVFLGLSYIGRDRFMECIRICDDIGNENEPGSLV